MVMSAAKMIEIVTATGVEPHMAKRLYSQIRKGAKLRGEWQAAFACGKFVLKQGRFKEGQERIVKGMEMPAKLIRTVTAEGAARAEPSRRDDSGRSSCKRARTKSPDKALVLAEMAIVRHFNDDFNSMGVPAPHEVVRFSGACLHNRSRKISPSHHFSQA